MVLEVILKLQKERVMLVPQCARPHFGRLLPRDPNRYCPDRAHCMRGVEIRLWPFCWLSMRKPGGKTNTCIKLKSGIHLVRGFGELHGCWEYQDTLKIQLKNGLKKRKSAMYLTVQNMFGNDTRLWIARSLFNKTLIRLVVVLYRVICILLDITPPQCVRSQWHVCAAS